MRVTGGKYRGRKLIVPKGQDIRPTTDKVRQAVFNILLSYGLPKGAKALDVFCGTGALGLEALSRGADHCIFVDKRRESLECARKNIEAIGLDKVSYGILQKEALKTGRLPVGYEPASLAFFDPPYRKDLVFSALESFSEQGWLVEESLCVVECEKEYNKGLPQNFSVLDQRYYGDIQIIIGRYK